MRVLCLWFRRWPAQRVRVAASCDLARPVVVHAPLRNVPRVAALNAAAEKRGVAVGMPLAEADSLLAGADPLVAPLDAAADLAELKRLALMCGRFGPAAGIEEGERPESALIDCTGCGPFFGGEEPLAAKAVLSLLREGCFARAGLADTVGLAWACSRASGRSRVLVLPAGRGEAWLPPQPVEMLRLDGKTSALLRNLGLRTVGDLLRLPRPELPSRFGPGLLRRLDQALGRLPEAIEPVRPPEPLAARWSGEFPLTNRRAVEAVLVSLLGDLLPQLAPWQAVAALVCRFGERPGPEVRPASPSRSADRLLGLLRLALDRTSPPRDVNSVSLTAEAVRLPASERTSLFADGRDAADKARAVSRLVERLGGRLGGESVLRPAETGDPLPERAVRFVPALAGPSVTPAEAEDVRTATSRPVLLLPEPEPVRVLSAVPDGRPHRLVRDGESQVLTEAFGPERFETGWAAGPEARRDYWRVETERGERLWLFRCRRTGAWFLHGLFG